MSRRKCTSQDRAGYEEIDENGIPLGMRLLKSLYGLWSEPNELVEHDRRTSGGNWPQKSQIGPLRLHLLGERREFYLDPVRWPRSISRKKPSRVEADQAEADESILNDRHGRCVTSAWDGRHP